MVDSKIVGTARGDLGRSNLRDADGRGHGGTIGCWNAADKGRAGENMVRGVLLNQSSRRF